MADLDAIVTQRIQASRDQRLRSRRCIDERKPLLAEDNLPRRLAVAERLAPDAAGLTDAEAVQGDSVDYVDAAFLPIGGHRSRAVAAVMVGSGSPIGSGFLISPRLFLTNNHVLSSPEDAAAAQLLFDYEIDEYGRPRLTTSFALDPKSFFHTVGLDSLDYTLVAVRDGGRGPARLSEIPYCPLSDRPDKHAKGICVNIVQHPNGGFKKVVMRENRIVARGDFTLHYEADTEPGSSGSPVFNDNWEVVALHHWGSPHLETRSVDGETVPVTVNEGVRISSIVADLKQAGGASGPEVTDLLGQALALGDAAGNVPDLGARVPPKADAPGSTGGQTVAAAAGPAVPADAILPADGATVRINLVVPLEIGLRLAGGLIATPVMAAQQQPAAAPAPATVPAAAAPASVTRARIPTDPAAPVALASTVIGAERVSIDPDFANRSGFASGFLPGLKIGLEAMLTPLQDAITPLNAATEERIPGLLDYEHFSLAMHRGRRLAILTATNIDGASYIEIDRRTGQPAQAEAGDRWFDDARVDPAGTVRQDFYSANSAYFDRGHLTRRSDPTWGTATRAIRANADTFHFTNCSPQHWLFNQSVKFWQGVERFYLEFGAQPDHARLSVLQGPVFGDDDPSYDEVQVPLTFWKIVLRLEDGVPKATTFLVSQEKLLKIKRRGQAPTALDDTPEVDEYRVPLRRIAALTGLDLGALLPYDSFESGRGAELVAQVELRSWADLR
ncbi:DNA/RNA non-specific endonuclease [Muricoccus aerilatus]|uniref:DNA/RNA non-specific endonuclease n=1 Tax=Muricoccus aerilatus TaxID=452982 RepID=UPI000693B030|nr:DNA/RNA non-specific endonuclease [Roseomonas aerilata]